MAVFINAKSAELADLENGGGDETAAELAERPPPVEFGTHFAFCVRGMRQDEAATANDGNARVATPSRMACHCQNSATTSSRYENVAISVPSSPSLPTPSSDMAHELGKVNEMAMGRPFSTNNNNNNEGPLTRNLSIRASLHSTNSARHSIAKLGSPNSFFAKVQLFYQQSPLRHFGPFLLLIAYALLGALLFFVLESEHERQLLENEQHQLELLRSRTIQRLESILRASPRDRWNRSRKILADYERDFVRWKVPVGTLEWSYLGALFYVGTVFTTIGYGNITPRTTPGQALSILYAIVGIPLVLAILNQTSRKMTKWLSELWICYRARIKAKKRRVLTNAKTAPNDESTLEKGRTAERQTDEEGKGESMESRTIPVWMALSIVSGYVCTIAAIFLIWESRWSYFTSFYFICISCLTIGLGDVIPDNPHMLILMFVFVIFGLSFVSMLLSVIQIKMEEWLYKMMIQMQKEYQKALLDVSDPAEREQIIAELFAKEPWYMRQLAPFCASETQKAKLENLTQCYEKAMRASNTRETQTVHLEEEEEQQQQHEVSTRVQEAAEQKDGGNKSLRAAKTEDEYVSARAALSSRSRSMSRSISDATSLPMDPASISPRHFCTKEVQTELDGNSLERMTRDRERETEEKREKEKEEKEKRETEREREQQKEEKEKREREREQEKEEKERKQREREKEEKEKREKEEKERKKREKEEEKQKEKQRAIKMQSKAVGTSDDLVVRREHRGTQLKAAISNKRTDTKGLIQLEERGVDSAELICTKTVAKAVQTDQMDKMQQRSVLTMFPSNEQPTAMEADQRRRMFSLTGREAEFEEVEGEEQQNDAKRDAWAQCSPPPEFGEVGVQTDDLFEVDGTVEKLLEDDDDASNSGGTGPREERSESVTAMVGDELEQLLDIAYPRRAEKKDLVIQTDDSYLRIARRLDKLRTNRTDINVYCTGTNPPPRKRADGRRKSLRFLEPIRDSFRPRRQSKTPDIEETNVLPAESARAEAENCTQRPTPKGGRVAQLVASHEGSIHRDSPPPPLASAMATVANRARRNVRHVRLPDERQNGDDRGDEDG